MGFDALLGNVRLKNNLIASLQQGRASHFYLISGPVGSGKKTLAALLAAGLLCQKKNAPCGHCSHCRKALERVHPDVIWVEDAEHKNVSVKIVRQMRDDVFVRPNEGSRKIYIFPQELGVEGQNALLKVLEEPPSYGVFLLLTDNPEKILPTVRSRCVELPLQPLEEGTLRPLLQREFPQATADTVAAALLRSGGFLGQARALLADGAAEKPQTADFVRSFADRNGLLLARTLAPMEKWKRDALLEILQQWLEIVEGAMAARAGLPALSKHSALLAGNRSASELNEAAQQLKKVIQYAQGNVSPAAICGYLQWALR